MAPFYWLHQLDMSNDKSIIIQCKRIFRLWLAILSELCWEVKNRDINGNIVRNKHDSLEWQNCLPIYGIYYSRSVFIEAFLVNVIFVIVNFLPLRTQISTEVFLHMRYDGTDCALICNVSPYKTEKVISRDSKYALYWHFFSCFWW